MLKYKKIPVSIVGAVIVLIILLIAVAWWPRALTKVIVADAKQVPFAYMYIAEANGYFKAEGLDVEYKPFPLGKDALQDVVVGNSHIALAFETPVVLSVYGGNNVGIVASLHSSTKDTGLIVRKDKGILTPRDLGGKRIGVPKNTNADFFLHTFLAGEGIRLSDVTIVDVKHDEAITMLINGNIDAAAIWNISAHIKNPALEKDSQVFYSDTYTEASLVVAQKKFINDNPEIMKSFLTALARAEKYYKYTRESSIDIVDEALQARSRSEVASVLESVDLNLRLDNVLLSVLNREAKWYQSNGMFKNSPPDFTNTIITSILNDVKPEGVTLAF